jgi:hypothetical protein
MIPAASAPVIPHPHHRAVAARGSVRTQAFQALPSSWNEHARDGRSIDAAPEWAHTPGGQRPHAMRCG